MCFLYREPKWQAYFINKVNGGSSDVKSQHDHNDWSSSLINAQKKGSINEISNYQTNEWMNESINQLTNERTKERKNEQTNEWTNERMNEWMNEWMNEQVQSCLPTYVCLLEGRWVVDTVPCDCDDGPLALASLDDDELLLGWCAGEYDLRVMGEEAVDWRRGHITQVRPMNDARLRLSAITTRTQKAHPLSKIVLQ